MFILKTHVKFTTKIRPLVKKIHILSKKIINKSYLSYPDLFYLPGYSLQLYLNKIAKLKGRFTKLMCIFVDPIHVGKKFTYFF